MGTWKLYSSSLLVQNVHYCYSTNVQTDRYIYRKKKKSTGDSMSSSNWTEQRSHLSNVWARCMIFLTIFSRSVCSSNRSLTTSKSAWTPVREKKHWHYSQQSEQQADVKPSKWDICQQVYCEDHLIKHVLHAQLLEHNHCYCYNSWTINQHDEMTWLVLPIKVN